MRVIVGVKRVIDYAVKVRVLPDKSGVDLNKVNAEFFPDGRWRANFLINLGHGDDSKLFDRNPRLSFEQACKIL